MDLGEYVSRRNHPSFNFRVHDPWQLRATSAIVDTVDHETNIRGHATSLISEDG